MTTIAHIEPDRVVVGVDTHQDVHVAVALDHLGRRLGERHIPATAAGYEELLAWAEEQGEVVAFGVDGTGCYGAGLSRFLTREGHLVIEVLRPNRQTRRRRGKSDPLDAEAAARVVLSGEASGRPKGGDGQVEAIRTLRVARATAMKARTQTINALRAVVVTAPEELRSALLDLPAKRLALQASRLRPAGHNDLVSVTKESLKTLGHRYLALDEEIAGRTNASTCSWPRSPPSSSSSSLWAPTRPGPSSSPPATTPNGSDPRPPSPCSAEQAPSTPPPGNSSDTASTAAATGKPTPPSTGS